MRKLSRWTFPFIALCLVLSICPSGIAQNSQVRWDAAGWVDDLHLIRQVLLTKYANLQWLTEDRQVDFDALFAETEARVRASGSDAGARAAFDRLVRKINDAHVALDWPTRSGSSISDGATQQDAPGLCAAAGYEDEPSATGIVTALPGYEPMGTSQIFQAGTVPVDVHRVGVLRIDVFLPNRKLCVDGIQKLKIPTGVPCGDSCQEMIDAYAYTRMTEALEEDLRGLQSRGAEALLIDLTNNGGGSEWAEAAARIITSKQLVSEPFGYVRGPHWQKQWADLAANLTAFAKSAAPPDRARLNEWAAEANRAAQESRKTCSLQGACSGLGRAGYASGLVKQANSREFSEKPWGKLVFSPAEFTYSDSLWTKPVIILVDQGTASAAEEFAAVLQDNRAALIVGSRTLGAGCGYTNGGTPTSLPHTGATLKVPDCARFRADGSNEVNGILPDAPIPWRRDDGTRFKARLLEVRLPSLIQRFLSGESGSTAVPRHN
jgi:hypothetical protein